MRCRAVWSVLAGLLASCGGGGGSGGTAVPANPVAPPAPPPVVNQSPGGIWHGFSTSNGTLNLIVAETGALRALETSGTPPSAPPLFGSGALLVSAGNRLDGAYDSGRPFSSFSEHCELSGTLTERVSISIELECSDASGARRTSEVILGYDSDYDRDSSLAAIEANYQFALRPSNVLSFDANGVIFGTYDNGPNCTVNGDVAIIDPRYNLYAIEWRLSLCQGLVSLDGATLTGFGVKDVRGSAPGSLLVLLTGTVNGQVAAASLLYTR